MAGLVGGSTGAALAAIVMIFEMTLDYNVIIPMALSVAIAYDVRKLISKESIYTFKLLRRGHRMPEALETNAHFLHRAADLTVTYNSATTTSRNVLASLSRNFQRISLDLACWRYQVSGEPAAGSDDGYPAGRRV